MDEIFPPKLRRGATPRCSAATATSPDRHPAPDGGWWSLRADTAGPVRGRIVGGNLCTLNLLRGLAVVANVDHGHTSPMTTILIGGRPSLALTRH